MSSFFMNSFKFEHGICLTIIAATSILSVIPSNNADLSVEKTKVANETCQTEHCQKAATIILGNMDTSVQPCDNFYQFACGNYKKDMEFSGDLASYSVFQDYTVEIFEKLKTALEEENTEEDPEAFKKLRKFYKLCMNESYINANSEGEFQQILEDLGGWPVLVGKSWNESSFDWVDFVLKIDSMDFSLNQFFSSEVHVDAKNSSGYIIQLDHPTFGIDQEYLQKSLTGNTSNKIVKAYLDYMIGVAKTLGANGTDLEEEMREALEFEKNLANISMLMRGDRDLTKMYNPMTIAEMQDKYRYVQWTDFLQKLFLPTVQLSPFEKINLLDRGYFEKLPEKLAKFSKRTLANYAFWRLIQNSLPYLSTSLRTLTIQFNSALYGITQAAPRWRKCIAAMKNELSIVTGALYVRKYLDRHTKNNATDLFDRIKGTFGKNLEKADWMGNDTRKAAVEKLENMIPYVAYPDEYLDDEKLDAFYENVTIISNSYLKSSLSRQSNTKKREYEYLRKKVNRTDWTQYYYNAAEVNAYNDLDINVVDIKAGILQGMMFGSDYPRYINYGGIGAIIGHEISHGFDDRGKMKDKDGNIENWWDAQSAGKFLEQAQCVVEQYNNYSVTIDGKMIHLDGRQTIGENIADIGGLKTAYHAYEDWQTEHGEELRLPGLGMFTPKQMFWISYANAWCATYRPEYLKDLIETETHTYEPFRIIGSVSNRPEFSRDFSCFETSSMNPAKKCNIW